MAQKTLLSFFKLNPTAGNKTGNATKHVETIKEIRADDDSPVKVSKSARKRIRISSSSSDDSNQGSDEVKDIDSPVKSKVEKKRKKDKSLSPVKKESAETEDVKKVEENGIETQNGIKEEVKDDEDVKKVEENGIDTQNGIKEEVKDNEDVNKGPYNPNISNYDPIKSATWRKGQKVPYQALARTLEEIENVSARLKMIEILSNYLRSVMVLSPEDLLPSIYLCLNRFGPAHEGVELGLAEQTLIRAISQSTGRTVTQIRNESQELGDLGIVAERSRTSQRLMFQPAALTVSGIYKKFLEICKMTGQAAVNKKITTIQMLYIACKGPEARFLIRSLNGKLRIGLAEQSVLQAIALACATTPPGQDYPPKILNASKSKSAETFKAEVDELALLLKTTYCECPNYELIIPVLLKEGIRSLPQHCKITPGLPMKPMLAQPTKGVAEVFSRFEGMEFTCEWKYDGERAQIHGAEDGSVKIFSRNQEDNTSKYPDIISRMDHAKKDGVKSFILDCEAVAWDDENKKILPFQVLSTRKRKDANAADIKVPVCLFMFDLLYLNNEPLVKKTLHERRRLLRENFNHVDGEWMFATSIDSSKIEEVQEFLEESVKGNCEGLMVKTLKEESTYEIAKRSRNWLKLKKDYLEGVGDTLDLVVLGGYFGKGKRTGTYGGFLVGCYDDSSEEYQSVCKLGTGFSDDFLTKSTEFFKSHVIPKAPSYYQHDSSLEPDQWFSPVQVWEIKCADLSLSPVHRAGIGVVDPDKGISLRFPRFLRIREDKKPEEGTTMKQIIDMYNNQEQVKSQGAKKAKFTDDGFY